MDSQSTCKDIYFFETIYGLKSIILRQGDLTALAEVTDVLVISAFQFHYHSSKRTLIGNFYRQGIDIAEIAKSPEFDLRNSHGVWLSKKIQAPNIKRIACVEFKKNPETPIEQSEIKNKLESLFALLSPAQYSAIDIDTVAMPFIGSGGQNISEKDILQNLIMECKRGMEKLPGLSQIMFIDLNAEKVKNLSAALDEFLGRTNLELTSIVLDEYNRNLVNKIIHDMQYIIKKRFENKSSRKKEAAVIFEFLDMLINIENRRGFECSVLCRRLLEVIINDFYFKMFNHKQNPGVPLANSIEKIATHFKMARWIKAYFDLIRILGNTSAHSISDEIPEYPSIEDFRILLHCLSVVIPYWKNTVVQ